MIHAILEQLYLGQDLKQDDVTEIFSQVVTGQVDDIVLSSLLTALKIKGEQPEEIAGAAAALIANAAAFPRPDYEFADIVGTGGDGHNTINISSASAIVAAIRMSTLLRRKLAMYARMKTLCSSSQSNRRPDVLQGVHVFHAISM